MLKKPVMELKAGEKVKPWRLPYWTDKAVWESERFDDNIRLRSRVKIINPSDERHHPAEEAVDNPLPEEEAAAIEDVEALPLPTAEELENIRRDAYTAGLEQGQIEGRQQGYKESYDIGLQEGRQEGTQQGHSEGYNTGFKSGEESGKLQSQAAIDQATSQLNQLAEQLQSHIDERDQQLPQVLANIVAGVCHQVVGEELKQGAENILAIVQKTLDALPEGEEKRRIYISAEDAPHLQQGLANTGLEMQYQIDETLTAGSCRVEGEHALAEFSSQEHLDTLLTDVMQQLQSSGASATSQQTDNEAEVALTTEVEAAQTEIQTETQAETEAETEAETPEADCTDPTVEDHFDEGSQNETE